MIHQDVDIALSTKGIDQSYLLAEYIAHIPIDAIISSDHRRARETADIIRKSINREVISMPIFREIKPPSELLGLPLRGKERDRIHELKVNHQDDPDWHYADEENFFDGRSRAEEALRALEKIPFEHIVVVTHSLFLFHIVSSILFPSGFTPAHFRQFKKNINISNTGITICEYAGNEQRWKLLTWNDCQQLDQYAIPQE